MSDQSSNVPSINMISEGTRIVGSLSTQKDFRISGEVEGELRIEGKCIVASTAFIKGDIYASDADIAGKIDGEIIVKNKLIIRQSGQVTGDVHTKVLLVEEGARFEGACHMGTTPLGNTSRNGTSDAKTLKINQAVNQ